MLSDVCLTSVAYIMNIHGAHSYWKQVALGAAGVRRLWAGARPQRAAYRGGGHIVRHRAQLATDATDVVVSSFFAGGRRHHQCR